MKQIYYKNSNYKLNENESVLDCLLRENEEILYSCKSGVCQSCLMQAIDGEVPGKSQIGLKSSLKQQKFFLACQCYPEKDLTIQNIDHTNFVSEAVIIEKILLTHNIIKLSLKTNQFECEPGQYLTLLVDSNRIARSYSIANNPNKDGFIELHIKLIDNGLMSQWLKNEANIGCKVTLHGPAGNCFYSEGEGDDYPIILAGTGTGLAPLYAVIHQALDKGHQGKISLFHGALRGEDLYFIEELKSLEKKYENFKYSACVLNGENNKFYQTGDIQEIVLENIPEDKENVRLFLCGAPEMVNDLKLKAFIKGLLSKNIYAEAFIPTKLKLLD